MPERFLSGAESRFSDCFIVLTYRYVGERKLTELQENTLNNINRQRAGVPLVNREGPAKELAKMFKRKRQRHSAHSVILDAEQIPVERLRSAINATQDYFAREIKGTYKGVVIATVAGNKFFDTVVNRPGVECNFGFTFRYHSEDGWDEEFIRDNVIVLDESNPDVRKVVDINRGRITEDDFSIRGGDLVMEFSINQTKVTLDEITAITNAVEGFARKAAVSSKFSLERRIITAL